MYRDKERAVELSTYRCSLISLTRRSIATLLLQFDTVNITCWYTEAEYKDDYNWNHFHFHLHRTWKCVSHKSNITQS